MVKERSAIERFWLEKETEHRSRLVIATPAEYMSGYPGLEPPVSGLLYVMRNGIYFENFPHNANWFSTIIKHNEQFTKIRLYFNKENIIGVSCFHRQKGKRSLALYERLSLFFSPASQQFIVRFMYAESERNAIFNCVKKPLLLCDAYDSTSA